MGLENITTNSFDKKKNVKEKFEGKFPNFFKQAIFDTLAEIGKNSTETEGIE